MKNKKTEVITFRVDTEIKEKIDKIATKKEWSISQAVEYICKNYFDQINKFGKTPTEAVKTYKEKVEEEFSEIPLDQYENNEDLLNETYRLLEIALK